ncbi:MBL fold metallo-hydrolase [Pseudarthrobacter sp. J1738]|uniref:MBL fold metallo-hydrolase n=1 Tax=unclassified Pseudarthrobacter TaxID=2647000 RepID=UPI003D2D57BB
MGARIDNVVTSGTFSLDGGTWDVDNNVWIVGDDSQCLIIDPAHNPQKVSDAVGQRKVTAILLTHGHDDHVRAALEAQKLFDAPVYLSPADRMLWDTVHPDTAPDAEMSDGQKFEVAGTELVALATPGHSPGSVSFYIPELSTVITGDTLFKGGPGATGRSFSDFPTIIESIKSRLLTLPGNTKVLTGHGDSTTIGAEAPDLQDWITRGH